MPTTFNVISLGVQALIDPTEGNTSAENASALVGLTIGDVENPLWEQVQSMSPSGAGFGGGTATAYDMNNTLSNEQFSLDGGPAQTFDGTSIYNATITYTDGTTATITAVVFQDTDGNTYLAPEFSANTDQVALEAGPIRSITFDSLFGNNYSGLTGSRETFDAMVCFTSGTQILTPKGLKSAGTLQVGDKVWTIDNGAQTIRWIGKRTVPAIGNLAPIRIERGALGHGLPQEPLYVSRQHRILIASDIAQSMFGAREILVAAHQLCVLPGIETVKDLGFVTYVHFMCDAHEIVFANGMPSETLHLGEQAELALGPDAMAEIHAVFGDLTDRHTARHVPKGRAQKQLLKRISQDAPALA